LRLPGAVTHKGVLVEDRAIGTDLDRRYVLVVGADKKVESRTVVLGPLVAGLRLVRQGLEPGELVVINGLQRVRPGMAVNATVAAMETPEAGFARTGGAR
jgi:multidrug efflux pump subunit AcrA (membrane-fusion protein)